MQYTSRFLTAILITIMLLPAALQARQSGEAATGTLPADSAGVSNNSYRTDTLTVAFLPALSYSSDLGLLGGGLMNRYRYAQGVRPFYSFANIAAIASTRGLFSLLFFYDKPHAFDTDLRLSSRSVAARFLQDQYYGVRNYDKLQDPPSGKPDYYLFNSFQLEQEFTLRKPVLNTGNGQLDLNLSLSVAYETPFDSNSDQLIYDEQPEGYEGGRTVLAGAGFIFDNRDNEFRPGTGNYFAAHARTGRTWFGSTYNYSLFEADFRTFRTFHLIRDITLANRLYASFSEGEVPFWDLADLGGEESLRGFAENRFLDRHAWLVNTELRTWLFEISSIGARIGGTLFLDIGSTFGPDTGNPFSDNTRISGGFGGNSSFFSDDFIFRGDFGFSEEGMGVYFTAGYMF